jgi:hypothetical protein
VAARSTGLHDRDHRVRSCSLLGPEPVDHVAPRQGMGRIWSARAHAPPGRSFPFSARTPDVPQASDAAAALASPSASVMRLRLRSSDCVPNVSALRRAGLSRRSRPSCSALSQALQPSRVAFSAPEKPPDACTPAARREGWVAAQCCATRRRKQSRTSSRAEPAFRSSRGMPSTLPGRPRIPCAGPAGRTSRL